MDAEKERNKVAHEQETREAQQGKRRWCGPKRQKHSKVAHGQENQKAQQERGVVNKRSGEPSKCCEKYS